MGKKRKARGQPFGEPKETPESSRRHIATYEDVADSEDEFHLNRDKVLFEELPARKKQRKAAEEGEFPYSIIYTPRVLQLRLWEQSRTTQCLRMISLSFLSLLFSIYGRHDV